MEEETGSAQTAESRQEKGLGGRMIGVFFSPGETFASVNRKVGAADWLVPLILMVLVALISVRFTMPVILSTQKQAVLKNLEKNESMTEEQRAKAVEKLQKIGAITTQIAAPIAMAGMIFVQALIFLALANFLLGGSGTFKKTLAIVSYSSLIGIPAAIVTVPLVLARGTINAQVSLGPLLPQSMSGGFLYHFLLAINLFSIWQYALVAIGLGIVAGVPTKRTAYGVFALWILYCLAAAGVRSFTGA